MIDGKGFKYDWDDCYNRCCYWELTRIAPRCDVFERTLFLLYHSAISNSENYCNLPTPLDSVIRRGADERRTTSKPGSFS